MDSHQGPQGVLREPLLIGLSNTDQVRKIVYSLQVGIARGGRDVILNSHQRRRIHGDDNLKAELPHRPLAHKELPKTRGPNPKPLSRQLGSSKHLNTPDQSKGVGLEDDVLISNAIHCCAALEESTTGQPLNLSRVPTPSQRKELFNAIMQGNSDRLSLEVDAIGIIYYATSQRV
uniref:Uncharacterized protein n=1 Tax=Fagus sylvatica TaxID=28930 RepID=A0A2N9JBT4_FAGSY